MAPCSLRHYHSFNCPETFFRGVVKYHRFIIKRAGKHTCVRQCNIMRWGCFIASNIVFRTQHPFSGDVVGISAVKPFLRISAMKHDHDFMICTGLCYAVIKVDCFLIVPVYKISHNKINAPFIKPV